MAKRKTKVGVFGGSFNPVHTGHLVATNEILNSGVVDEVWLMPCFKHVFKPSSETAPITDRMQMLLLSVGKNPKIVISEFEIDQGENKGRQNYSIDTVRELKKNYPEFDFSLIIGSNLVDELPKWKNIGTLLKETKLIIVAMPDFAKEKVRKSRLLSRAKPVILDSIARTNISSTEIRKRVKAKKSIEYLVPEKVREFIEHKRLYRK